MPLNSFVERFLEFVECNGERRALERQGGRPEAKILDRWQEARRRLAGLYPDEEDRRLLAGAVADPYFPLNMLKRVNVEEFQAESRLSGLSREQLAVIMTDHLLRWSKIFQAIRKDLHRCNRDHHISSMRLDGSPEELVPEEGWCDFCGGCCEIRGGPPEFTGNFAPPRRWLAYFAGEACRHQRFCPFLFEYFASGRFFCAIYRVKPRGCWEFGREECEFLKTEVARGANP